MSPISQSCKDINVYDLLARNNPKMLSTDKSAFLLMSSIEAFLRCPRSQSCALWSRIITSRKLNGNEATLVGANHLLSAGG